MYAKIINGQVAQFPYTTAELRRDNPSTSFPQNITDELLAAYDVYKVVHAEPPEFNETTQKIIDGEFPVFAGGVWTIPRSVAEKSELEIAIEYKNLAAAMRNKRNELLAECDWTQGKDVPNTVSDFWGAYRQALRDVPLQVGFPHSVVWPKKPDSSNADRSIEVAYV